MQNPWKTPTLSTFSKHNLDVWVIIASVRSLWLYWAGIGVMTGAIVCPITTPSVGVSLRL